MTSQGHPYARFKRALASRNATLATAAAQELEQVALDDALRLVLLYRDARDWRFERAALRWASRLGAEIPAVGFSGAAVALQAFAAIGRGDEQQGAEALAVMLDAASADELFGAIDDWIAGAASQSS